MGSILIAMPKTEDAKNLKGKLISQGIAHEVEVCQNAAEVLRVAGERNSGVILCTKNLRDMHYNELAEYMPSYFQMIVLTKDMTLDIYSDRVVKLNMPFKMVELFSTLEMMLSPGSRRKKDKKQGPKKRTPEEEKMIADAKAILMDRNGMSEPEAFRYIQKMSMDMSRSFVETAQMILVLNV